MNSLFDQYIVSKYYDENSDAILLEGDTLDILKRLPDNRFKLIVSSPPYNIGKIYEEEVSLEEYLEWQEKIIIELYRTCHVNGSVVWQIGNYVDEGEIFPLDIYFYPIFKKMGLKLRNRIIWHFGHNVAPTPVWRHEDGKLDTRACTGI